MQILALELKRMLKTRLTLCCLAAALLLTALCAWTPTTFVETATEGPDGSVSRISGLPAIDHYRQYNETMYGEVKAEMVREAIEIRQRIYREYDSEYGENLPELVYFRDVWPYIRISKGALELLADRHTGFAPEVAEIDAAMLDDYYGLLEGRLSSVLQMENPGHPAAEASAMQKFARVPRPYTYYFGIGSDNMDYECLLLLAISLICALICATVFSSDAQTGAEDILLCCKHGTRRLALAKIGSALIICLSLLLACGSLWIVLTGLLFGREGNLSSVQIIYSVTALLPWNMGQLQWRLLFYTLLLAACTVAFTLLISARCRSNVTAVSASLLAAVLPMITYVAVPDPLERWLQCLLPSGGIGTANSILYLLTSYDHLHLGAASYWQPNVLLAVSAVELPLFLLLTLLCCRRKTQL